MVSLVNFDGNLVVTELSLLSTSLEEQFIFDYLHYDLPYAREDEPFATCLS